MNRNQTWILINLPKESKAIGCIWVFCKKDNERYKERLVVKGYAQKEGIDYNKIFTLVFKHTSILTGKENSSLQAEEVTIWAEAIAEAMIQAIWQFYAWQEATKSKYNPYVYCNKLPGREYIYLLLYVDAMLISFKSRSAIDRLKKHLSFNFEIKEVGEAKKVLGMKIERDKDSGNIHLTQKGYL